MIERDEGESIFQTADGAGIVRTFSVFPGIELVYRDIRCRLLPETEARTGSFLVIDHCRVGRMDWDDGKEIVYLTGGDLAVSDGALWNKSPVFPMKKYEGIEIVIDLDRAPESFFGILDDIDVDPAALKERLCADGCYIARSSESVLHIFSELYNVPESIRRGYFKVKVLELLLFLSCTKEESNERAGHSLSRAKTRLAGTVRSYIDRHPEEKLTIPMLAEKFHVSETGIKESFKAVYDISPYAYIRRQKMREAASLLRGTDRTVLEIAGQFGYDNAGKFAKAFREVMGQTPREYRKGGNRKK